MLAKTSKTLFLFLMLLFSAIAFAQNDVILKKNGEEMQGKVMKMNQDDLIFVYKNETVEYPVKFSDIIKITFASGRVQNFNTAPSTTALNTENHQNKAAILPFGYIKDQETSNTLMTQKIQLETYKYFKQNAVQIQFQDPMTTNALLAKAGINESNLQAHTIDEIANILGVAYIVNGLVSIVKTSVTNSSYGSVDVKENSKNKTTANSSTYNYATQNYSTTITMNVYTDQGENIYTQDHNSFWQTEDAYKITLGYLAKRSPIFKR
ncbi:hypothetical protein [Flavobacterium agrisoli]|uniref:Uncharacterized protein n=1 Tax=Flavobacterium agrisoli TaxID=2793066 RepID=A0A934PMB5_9FLAO|nr:hypothetical protein [Flavobacterium agrisoli]MBK0369454.1 hypothetical protein [Flavobacterium agrisoli]